MKLHSTVFAAAFALMAGAPVLAADDHKGHDHASPTGAMLHSTAGG